MDNLAITTGGTALISALLIQWVKNVDWIKTFGIQPECAKANLALSVLVAAGTSLGVGWSYDKANGILVATISLHTVWHFFVQWASQHVAYKTVVVPTELLGMIAKNTKEIK